MEGRTVTGMGEERREDLICAKICTSLSIQMHVTFASWTVTPSLGFTKSLLSICTVCKFQVMVILMLGLERERHSQ
uniref:Uncharacterized protein n=1 Tax=Ascaris lumbricoides TaxID=6252 RepID=A0A0M3I5T9_ASCLU